MMPLEPGREPHVFPLPLVVERPRYGRYDKAKAVAFVILCMALGLFLLTFPWTDWWEESYFSTLGPWWRQHWGNMYARGAISGIGIVNLCIALMEVFRLRRFARR